MDEFDRTRRKKDKNICADKEGKEDRQKGNRRARREIKRLDEKTDHYGKTLDCDDETRHTLLDHILDRKENEN